MTLVIWENHSKSMTYLQNKAIVNQYIMTNLIFQFFQKINIVPLYHCEQIQVGVTAKCKKNSFLNKEADKQKHLEYLKSKEEKR